jgi:hypothetical protein
MKSITWMLLVICLSLSAEVVGKVDKTACAEVKEKIRTIESRMRAGYTRAQGERYEERLRELKAKRYKLCR